MTANDRCPGTGTTVEPVWEPMAAMYTGATEWYPMCGICPTCMGIVRASKDGRLAPHDSKPSFNKN